MFTNSIYKQQFISSHRQPSDNNKMPNDERDFLYMEKNNCEELEKHCPLSLLEMTPYTDI